MIRVNIHEAKTHLSHYLEEVEQGETIVVCRRNLPIAEIRPLARSGKTRRSIGLGKGIFSVPASFFEDLPEDMRTLFNGSET